MYQPAEFRETRAQVLHEHIRRHSLGILVSQGTDGLAATHAPFLFEPDHGEHGLLTSHLARRNPQWRDLPDGVEVLVIFRGPDAYVSPLWYTAEPDVPTWNYTAVHAHGVYRRLDGADATVDVLRRTVAQHEGERWRLDEQDPDLVAGLARGVVAFQVAVTSLTGGFKLSQDKLPADVDAVVGGLTGTGRPDALAVAAAVREYGTTGRTGASSTDPTSYGPEDSTCR